MAGFGGSWAQHSIEDRGQDIERTLRASRTPAGGSAPPRPPTLDADVPTRAIVSSDTRRPMTRWADGIARSLAGAFGRRFGRHNFRGRAMRGGRR
jgi:hypothetical protein